MKTALVFLLGAVSGAATVVAAWMYWASHEPSWISKGPVTLSMGENGSIPVVIPAHTEFLHQWFYSEGFDELCLDVDVYAPSRYRFDVVNRGGGTRPYDVPMEPDLNLNSDVPTREP